MGIEKGGTDPAERGTAQLLHRGNASFLDDDTGRTEIEVIPAKYLTLERAFFGHVLQPFYMSVVRNSFVWQRKVVDA